MAFGRTVANAEANPIRSCILLILYGGPSHLDMWDPKPDAPSEIRGEFRPIATRAPGLLVSEHLPRTAAVMDRVSLIRSLHHHMTNHNAAMYEALVGRHPGGGDNDVLGSDRSDDFPCYGSALTYAADRRRLLRRLGTVPHGALPHVMRNIVPLPGQNAGFLKRKYDPLQLTADPSLPNFRVQQLETPGDVPPMRLSKRHRLLNTLGAVGRPPWPGETDLHDRAFDLLANPRVRQAMRLDREPDCVRHRYGSHKLGQSLLLARRLVEMGVAFVNVNDKVSNGQLANWDSHRDNFPRHRDVLMPPADQAFAALIEDLDDRGLLDATLVIAMGEFGRTPRINRNAGRDHWPNCYSVAIAGGGVRGGTVYGSSDRIGAYPSAAPVTPGDLAATIYWRFGLDPHLHVYDRLNRPHALALGEPITPLFG